MGSKRDAPRYRKLYPMFWRDARVRTLTLEEKTVAAYCLTSHQTNRVGLFSFSLATAAEDLDMPVQTLAKRFGTVCRTLGWVYDNDARCLYIPSWWKWNQPENPNNMTGNLRDLAEVPESMLLHDFAQNLRHLSGNVAETFTQTLAKRLRNVPPNVPETLPERSGTQESRKAGTGKQESRNRKAGAGIPPDETSAGVLDVFAHYRNYHPAAFRIPNRTSKEWKLIEARLREGYSVEDLCRAIDGNHRSPYHCGQNPDGKKYQHLELIVRDGSKVSGFMEAADGPGVVVSEKNRRSLLAAEDFIREFGAEDES